jgi:hypothetical protein
MFNRVHIDVITKLFDTVNSHPFGKNETYTVPILEDIDSNTALDVALQKNDPNLANAFLKGIELYPFMHSGFVLVSGIINSFDKCPHLG